MVKCVFMHFHVLVQIVGLIVRGFMGKLTVEISDEDIVSYIGDKRDHEIVDIVVAIDEKGSSWNLTKLLAEHFIEQMQHYFDTPEEFEEFLDKCKG